MNCTTRLAMTTTRHKAASTRPKRRRAAVPAAAAQFTTAAVDDSAVALRATLLRLGQPRAGSVAAPLRCGCSRLFPEGNHP